MQRVIRDFQSILGWSYPQRFKIQCCKIFARYGGYFLKTPRGVASKNIRQLADGF